MSAFVARNGFTFPVLLDTTVDGGQASAAWRAFSGNEFGGWIDRSSDRRVRDSVAGTTRN